MIEAAAGQILDWLTTRTAEDYRRYVFLLLTLLTAYRMMRWIITRLAPWVVTHIAVRLVSGFTIAACIIALVLQVTAVLPFRTVRARPPGFLFEFGDMAVVGTRRLTSGLTRWASRTQVFRRVPRLLVLTILATMGWWGHETACRDDAESGWCRRPLTMAHGVGDDLWNRAVTFVRDASKA
ncbi:hypothetical protein V6W11_27805 [Micromonospora profundi]|uniref:hypothetical protein n=1 Tax=Micromonospora TaxID=1873 RepID=UPI000AA3ECFD|nr:hypothetical protein [Micromonospora sp. NRRL B-16802]